MTFKKLWSQGQGLELFVSSQTLAAKDEAEKTVNKTLKSLTEANQVS